MPLLSQIFRLGPVSSPNYIPVGFLVHIYARISRSLQLLLCSYLSGLFSFWFTSNPIHSVLQYTDVAMTGICIFYYGVLYQCLHYYLSVVLQKSKFHSILYFYKVWICRILIPLGYKYFSSFSISQDLTFFLSFTLFFIFLLFLFSLVLVLLIPYFLDTISSQTIVLLLVILTNIPFETRFSVVLLFKCFHFWLCAHVV